MKKIFVIVAISLLFVMASSAVAMAKQEEIPNTVKPTDTFKLKQGYCLQVTAINITADKAWMQLTCANGDVVDNCVVYAGECFNLYDDGALIVETEQVTIFCGLIYNLVAIDDLVQYNKNTGNPILTMDNVVLVCNI